MLTQKRTKELTQLLEQSSVKVTQKRLMIFHALINAERALSPYELAKQCEAKLSVCIPVVSIYRTLDLLVEANLAHKLELVNKYSACAHFGCHSSHHHTQFLICNVCQKVTEIQLSTAFTKQLIEQTAFHEFQLQSQQYEFQGICKDCTQPKS
ncbi:Fur family transcriptional regulator, zinc uptake regulator [Pseudoalteromonas citrea]|uniref:Fur family transcriptional regulator, zinc uptake regulator n=2 Tax=Pseudoalteromonas citrea TaxID=43655 RepID=A0AAD4AIE9_9GAMM|nr:transcriptional repressor [Pseudoalteromonas citrea]KAF7771138.1 Fur family transcriptional regulator, zinc uptake regulator [Pseudoalteromonas citrea]